MTMPQFNEMLIQLGRKIAWDIHLETISVTGKIDEKLHPLTPPPRVEKNKAGRASKKGLADFVNTVNKLKRR